MSTHSRQTAITGSLKRLLVWVAVLAIWETAFRVIGWRDWIFPAPSTLVGAFENLLRYMPAFGGRPLIQGIIVSMTRLALAFFLSVLLGGLIAILMWRFKSLDAFFGPLFLGMQTLPSVCWVPLAILCIGINENGVTFVVVMGSVFAIALSLRDGLRTIPPIYQRAGEMLGTRGWRMYRYVMLPASLPALASTLRLGFSFAWRSLMGAEMLFAVSHHGLGFFLQSARDYSGIGEVVALMMVIVMVGMLADRWGFAPLEQRIVNRFGLTLE